MQKDKFGRPVGSLHYGESWQPVEWDTSTTADVIYLRSSYEDMCVIERVDIRNERVSWAYGSWAARASLTYGSDNLIRGI